MHIYYLLILKYIVLPWYFLKSIVLYWTIWASEARAQFLGESYAFRLCVCFSHDYGLTLWPIVVLFRMNVPNF